MEGNELSILQYCAGLQATMDLEEEQAAQERQSVVNDDSAADPESNQNVLLE